MSKRSTTEQQAAGASSLVSRLVQAQHDPVKRRARQWLISIADQRLAEFGLSSKDIAVLRGRKSQSARIIDFCQGRWPTRQQGSKPPPPHRQTGPCRSTSILHGPGHQ